MLVSGLNPAPGPPSYLLVREHDIFPLYGSLSGYDFYLGVQKVRGLRVLALSRPAPDSRAHPVTQLLHGSLAERGASQCLAKSARANSKPQREKWKWTPNDVDGAGPPWPKSSASLGVHFWIYGPLNSD